MNLYGQTVKVKLKGWFFCKEIQLPCRLYSLVFFITVESGGVNRVDSHFLVVLLQSGHVFTSFREFALLHALANIPVDKRPFGVHQIELVVETGPSLGDCGCVRKHADGPGNLGKVPARNNGRRLVVDAHLNAPEN